MTNSTESDAPGGRGFLKFENHVQTGLATLLIAMVVWVGASLNKAQLDLARVSIKIENIESALNQASKDRYYSGDAARDFALRDQRLSVVEKRQSEIEERLKELEHTAR